MELALPHVVVRTFGSGLGADLVAALSVHPLEVSEARDRGESRRVAAGRPAILVVVAGGGDPQETVAEVRDDFRGTPILLIADPSNPTATLTSDGSIESIPAGLPLPDICWHVIASLGRAARRTEIEERPLGPFEIDIDETGVVGMFAGGVGREWLLDGPQLSSGGSIVPLVAPPDRQAFLDALRKTAGGGTEFLVVRLVDGQGNRHAVQVGLRSVGRRIAALILPLIVGGPIVGRHANSRDPITGLLTRWAMSRRLDAVGGDEGMAGGSTLLLLKLDHFQAIAHSIGFASTDAVLVRVASELNRIFCWPAVASRLMGDTFLVLVPAGDAAARIEADAEQLIRLVNAIDLPGFTAGFAVGASIGIARDSEGDNDLALRLAEAAVAEAQAAGGNRVVVAGSAAFTRDRTQDLAASLDLGDWEVWLQPVIRRDDRRVAFHEALARFSRGRRHMASRADFFTAGRAGGLLERFDRMLLLRAIDLLASHPDARLSVNVTYETFTSAAFPASVIDAVRTTPSASGRIILEIAPRCMSLPQDAVAARLGSLDEAGVQVSLDDFGSGICRLRYLTQFPIAYVKLDALVTGYVNDDPLQRELVRAVVSLCRARGITTVAEFTRSPEQMKRLIDDGVDLFQGELIGLPQPAEEVLCGLGRSSESASRS